MVEKIQEEGNKGDGRRRREEGCWKDEWALARRPYVWTNSADVRLVELAHFACISKNKRNLICLQEKRQAKAKATGPAVSPKDQLL